MIENFDCEGECNSDGSDVRVIANSVKEVPFGLQKTNSSYYNISFWANVTTPNGTNSSYYIYYGNSLASPSNQSWNPSRWNFYEDFESGSLDNRFDVHNGTLSVQGTIVYEGAYALNASNNPTFATIKNFNITDTGIYIKANSMDGGGDPASWDGFVIFGTTEHANQHQLKNSMRAVWHGELGGRLDHRWYNTLFAENMTAEATGCGMDEDNWYLHQAWWFRNNHTLF